MSSLPRLVLVLLLCGCATAALRAQTTPPAPGTLDPGFPASGGSGPDARVRAVLVQPADGKILVAGEFTGVNGVTRPLVARLRPDGSVDPEFKDSRLFPAGAVSALALQTDGKLLVGGQFYRTTDGVLVTVARLNPDGSLDPAFNPSPATDQPVRAVTAGGSGGVFVGGAFTAFAGSAYSGLVRLRPDGGVDAAGFDPGTGADGAAVNALARLPDGRLFAGGSFATFNGIARPGLVRLRTDGTVDPAFAPVSPAVPGAVLALVPAQTGGSQPNGVLLARAGGVVQRLTGAGGADPASTGVGFVQGGEVDALAVDDQGRILLGGSFTRYGATPRRGLARLLPDGTVDPAFDPGPGVDAAVRALALGADGGLVLGGDFSTVGGVSRPFLARVVTGPPAAGTLGFAVDAVSVGEGAGTLAVPVSRVGGTRGAVSVPVVPTLGGTAAEGVDYTLAGDGNVTFADGAASGTLTVNVRDNLTPQPDRTFTLALGTPTGGAALGTPASVTVTILDDDFPPVLDGNPATATGAVGQPFRFQITATNAPTRFAANGLPAGLAVNADTGLIAGTPTAPGVSVVTLSAANATGTSTAGLTIAVAPGTAPPVVGIEATTPTASAAAGLKGVFTLTRTGGDPAGGVLPPLTVYYKAKGSAVGGVDYKTLPGVAAFPGGATTVKVKVKPLPVGAGDATTVQLKLRAGDGYGVGSPAKATVTVGP